MTKYRVSGSRKIAGHAPGAVFEADFDEKKEARLTAAGFIEKVRANAKVREGDDTDQNEGGENA